MYKRLDRVHRAMSLVLGVLTLVSLGVNRTREGPSLRRESAVFQPGILEDRWLARRAECGAPKLALLARLTRWNSAPSPVIMKVGPSWPSNLRPGFGVALSWLAYW